MTLLEFGGLFGVGLIIVAFAGVQFEKMDARGFIALILNFVGAALVLVSMIEAFNLPAFVMETIWCAIALYGLAKLALRKGK